MLDEMTSEEFSEWMAFFILRESRREKNKEKEDQEEAAKKLAKENSH